MEWVAPRGYKLGDRATWRAVRLVCTRAHYAGDAAEHPWDPGDGWPPVKAATLWAPDGPRAAENLPGVLTGSDSDRLRTVLSYYGTSR